MLRTVLSVTVMGASLVLAAVTDYASALTDRGPGEPKPPGYGVEVCTTRAHDLATARGVVDRQTWDYQMNLISCEQDGDTGSWAFHQSRYDRGCGALAYAAGTALIATGHRSRQLTPAAIGRWIDQADHARDCALYEDGSWG